MSVRPLTSEERTQVNIERRCGKRVHRAQIVLAGTGGQLPRSIVQIGDCSVQTVRKVVNVYSTRPLIKLFSSTFRHPVVVRQ